MGKVLLLLPVVKGHSSHPSKHRQEPHHLLLQMALVARPQKEFTVADRRRTYSSPRDWYGHRHAAC